MNNNTWKLLENAIFETLEGRQMMSASPLSMPTLANGVVTVNGDATATSRVVADYGINHSSLVVDNNGLRATFPISEVKQLNINLGSGSDYFYLNPAIDIPADVHAGDGVDTIRTGAGDDSIVVGTGADVIFTNAGDNDVTVGSGNDIVRAGAGNDVITAGDGNDYLVGGGGTDVISAGNGNDTFLVGSSHDQVTAGTGLDTLIGGSGNTFTRTKGSTTGTGSTGTGSTGSGSTTGSTGTGSTGTGTTSTGTGTGTTTTGTGTSGTGSTGTGTKTSGTGTTTTGTGTTTTGTGTTTTGTGTGTTTTGTGTTGTGTTTTGTGSGTTGTGTGTTTTGTGTTGTGTSGTGTTGTGTTGTGQTGAGGTGITPTGLGTGATSTSTSGIGTDDVGPVVTYGWQNSIGQSENAVITTLAGPRVSGLVVNVSALDSALGAGTPIDTSFSWDFGDSSGAHNTITGYNGAHVYDTPGTYTIKLTMTNMNGQTSIATQTVTIAASARNQIYVDSTNGSDSNTGAIGSPLKTLTAAFAKLSNNAEILLRAGETFPVTASLDVNYSNVLIGRYGTGANPTTSHLLGGGVSTISVFSNTNGLTIQDITFDSPYVNPAGTTPSKIGVSGVFIGGQNVAVRDCTFLNIDDAFNENSNPTGVLIQDNAAPLSIGVRGYFVWGQGAEQVIIGNNVANSSREHNIRLVDLTEVTIEDNTLFNNDGKGCIECHIGSYEWIQGNSVTDGDIRVGPLGLWGEDPKSSTDFAVIQDNDLTNTFIYVQSGAHHVTIANNVLEAPTGATIRFSGVDSEGRTSSDITLLNNTAIDTGTQGNFLNVGGYVNGIVMKNNLWIAPNIQVGSYSTTPVYVDDADMSSFTEIGNNIWPSPDTVGTYAGGGINFVGTVWNTANFLTAAQWNNQSMVGTDVFQTEKLGDSYQITVGGVTAGSSLQMAA